MADHQAGPEDFELEQAYQPLIGKSLEEVIADGESDWEKEQDPEPLVPFTAKTIEMMKEIESEGVATNGKDSCPS